MSFQKSIFALYLLTVDNRKLLKEVLFAVQMLVLSFLWLNERSQDEFGPLCYKMSKNNNKKHISQLYKTFKQLLIDSSIINYYIKNYYFFMYGGTLVIHRNRIISFRYINNDTKKKIWEKNNIFFYKSFEGELKENRVT